MLRTDNRALVYVFENKASRNPKLNRMAMELQGLKFAVEHVPGRLNGQADAISRFPEHWLRKAEQIQAEYDPKAAEREKECTGPIRLTTAGENHL